MVYFLRCLLVAGLSSLYYIELSAWYIRVEICTLICSGTKQKTQLGNRAPRSPQLLVDYIYDSEKRRNVAFNTLRVDLD